MKYIKLIVKFLKSIFIKNSNSEIIESKEIEIQENPVDIKNIIEQVNIGDIIWAKRYKDEKEKESIPEGHKEGPYIVLNKIEGQLICSKGTSSENHEKRINDYFDLDNTKYNLPKKTYFRFFQLEKIDSIRFIRVLDSLKEDDLENVFRLFKRKYKYKTPEIKYLLQCGDIIMNNNINYLIIDILENKLVCIPLNINIQDLKFENFKNLDYSKIIYLQKNNKYKIKSNVTDNTLLYVLKKQKEYIENCKNKKVTQRGSIIHKENKYYYIYGEEGQDWLIFEINNNQNGEKIILNKQIFYTNYKSTKINKKDNFETNFLAFPDEIEKIKEQKKSYNKVHKNEKRYEAYYVGNIIETEYYKQERFIIIGLCKKTYECLSIDKIKKAIYDPILIRKQDAILSKNTSIEGIKWLEENSLFNLSKIGAKTNLDKIFNTQKQFLNKVNNQVESLETKLDIKRGSIIFKADKYYYVYGEEGQDWLTFEVSEYFDTEKIALETLDEIKILDKIYYTNYNNLLRVNKKDNFTLISNATDEEIEKIKKNKKSYNKTEKNNKMLNLKRQSCVEINGERYIIKEKIGNMIGCESIYDIDARQRKIYYFNVNDIDIIYDDVPKQKRLTK